MATRTDRPALKQNDLKTLMQELAPIARDWEDIGVYLGIDDGTLLTIKAEEPYMRGRLREMLRAWLRRVDPQATWTDLIDTVNHINESVADSIRSKHCDK